MSQATQSISSRILYTKNIVWRDLKFIQQETFKELLSEEEEKLRHSVITNQFTDPFKVWWDQTADIIYCLDGKHRSIILNKLEKEGIAVPETLPATFIYCTDIQEAAKMVLQYSSQYARTTSTGLLDFISNYDLDIDLIKMEINIPDINFDNILGDIDKDFSSNNGEINTEDFANEITLKLVYSREDYLYIKQRMATLMRTHDIGTPEDLLRFLLKNPNE